VIINDRIHYVELINYPVYEKLQYEDPFLKHLNDKINNKSNNQQNSSSNFSKSKYASPSKNKDKDNKDHLKPVLDFTEHANLENFKIKTAKSIFDFLIKQAPKGLEKKFLEDTILRFDFDNDQQYTIGELSNFLNYCHVKLAPLDLRFFFESVFQVNEKINPGHFSVDDLDNFIFDYSKKSFVKNVSTDYSNISKEDYLTQYEKEEEKQLENIVKTNYMFEILQDALKVLGKEYLINYFSNHIERVGDKYLLDSIWLEIGLKSLGYDELTSSEVGSFKFFCLKKNFSDVQQQDLQTVKVDVSALFNYLIERFRLNTMVTHYEYLSSNLLMNSKVSDSALNKILNSNVLNESEKITNLLCSVLFKDLGQTFVEKIVQEIDEDYTCIQPKSSSKENQKFLNNTVNEILQLNEKSSSINKTNKDNNKGREKSVYSGDGKKSSASKKQDVRFKHEVDEFLFRRQFIHSFGFIDHSLMNHFSSFLYSDITKSSQQEGNANNINSDLINQSENLLKNSFDFDRTITKPLFKGGYSDIGKENPRFGNKPFNMKQINSKKWIQLCFNFVFLGLIKNADQAGLLLDENDKFMLNNISDKVKQKIYPQSDLLLADTNKAKEGNTEFKVGEIANQQEGKKNPDQFADNEALKKELIKMAVNSQPKDKEELISLDKIISHEPKTKPIDVFAYLEESRRKEEEEKKKEQSKYDQYLKLKEKASKVRSKSKEKRLNSNVLNGNENTVPYNNSPQDISNINSFKRKNRSQPNKNIDTTEVLPLLSKTCSSYLKSKYFIESDKENEYLSEDVLKSLGACTIFKEMLTNFSLKKDKKSQSNTSYDSLLHRIEKEEFLYICEDSNIEEQIIDFFDYYLKKQESKINQNNQTQLYSNPLLKRNHNQNLVQPLISNSSYKSRSQSQNCVLIIREKIYINLQKFYSDIDLIVLDYVKMREMNKK